MRDNPTILLFQFRSQPNQRLIEQQSFVRSLGITPEQFRTVDVITTAPTSHDLDDVDGIVLGGSAYYISDNLPHQQALVATLQQAREKKIPMFGCCFGGQLIAHAFGGEVVRDEARSEFGTYTITTTDNAIDDILFADTPTSFAANCAHFDCIRKLPPGAILLATSEKCPVHAFTFPGTGIYGVQFHPERSKDDTAALLEMWKQELPPDIAESIRGTITETPEAESLLKKFVERLVTVSQSTTS